MNSALIRGLQITLAVSDVTRSVDFYRDELGFDFRGYWDDSGRSLVRRPSGAPPVYAEVQSGPYRVGLRAARGAVPAPAAEFTLFVEDLDAAHRQLRENGVETGEPRVEPWGGRMFSILDPDGHRWSYLEVPAPD